MSSAPAAACVMALGAVAPPAGETSAAAVAGAGKPHGGGSGLWLPASALAQLPVVPPVPSQQQAMLTGAGGTAASSGLMSEPPQPPLQSSPVLRDTCVDLSESET